MPACRSAAATPESPTMRAPRRHDSSTDPLHGRCEPPAKRRRARRGRMRRRGHSNSKASRHRHLFGWRPAVPPLRRGGRNPHRARRAARNGTERVAFLLLATSRRPDVRTIQRGLVLLGPPITSCVHRPNGHTTNDAERRYVIRWHDDDGHAMRCGSSRRHFFFFFHTPRSGTTLARPNRRLPPNRLPQAMPTNVNATSDRRRLRASRTPVPGRRNRHHRTWKPRRLIARFRPRFTTPASPLPSMTDSGRSVRRRSHVTLIGSARPPPRPKQPVLPTDPPPSRAVDWDYAAPLAAPRRRRRSWQAQAGRTP